MSLKKIADNIFVKYALSQGAANVLRLVSGFLVAKLVSPATLGLFQGLGLTHNYLPIAQMGIMNGLNRQYPYLLGKDEKEKAYSLVASAQSWFLFLGIISLLSLLIVGLFNIGKDINIAIGYIAYGISAFFLFYNNNFLKILYRAGSDFNNLSKITIISSILGFTSLIFVWQFGFIGLCIKLVFVFIVEYFLLKKWLPIHTKAKISLKDLKELFKIGFPIHLVGQVSALWMVLIKTLVLYLGGPLQLGYFAIALMINGTMMVIPSSIAQILYPKMSFMHGQGKSIKALLSSNIKPILINTLITIPLIIILYFLLPYLISTFLAKYSPGIEAARIMLILALISIISSFNGIFLVIEKTKMYLIAILGGISLSVIYIAIDYYLIGFSLTSFVWAVVWGKLLMMVINVFFIKNLIKSES